MFEIKLAYGMMLNALSQLRDGIPFDEVTINPDINKYYDMDMNQVLQFAGKVYDNMGGTINAYESVSMLREMGVERPFQWTFASGQKGKSIQLKMPML